VLLVLLVLGLVSDGSGPIPLLSKAIGVLPRWQTVAILTVLAVIGLRDKVIFLAARGEVYAPLALVFLFPGADIVVGAKVVFMVIWLGAATSKLNRHFPFVISTMLANNPFIPSGALKRALFKLDAQPIHIQRQEYRLVDAATGEFERGYVDVDDMVSSQPWADDLPVHVQHSTAAARRNLPPRAGRC